MACSGLLVSQASANDVSLSGTLESTHADYLSKGEAGPTRYYLRTRSGKRFKLNPKRSLSTHVGDRVSLTGASSDGAVTVNSANFSEGQPVADAPGARKVAVILFNFEDQTAEPWTQSQARGYVFSGSNSVNEYFKEESSNTLSLTGKNSSNGDVFGWYTIPYSGSGSCNWTTWTTQARAMAEAAGNDMSGYDHYLYASPNSTACGFGGVAYMPGTRAYVDGYLPSLRTVAHELSHNLGVHHSATMNCGAAPLPVTYTDYSGGSAPAGCTYSEYGDPFDLMGAAGTYQHNNQHKGNLELQTGGSGFLTGTTQTVASNGIYTLEPSEPGFAGTQVLRIPRSANPQPNAYSYYYLDYRRPYGSYFDSFSPTGFAANGVTLRTAGDYGSRIQTRLIDATPPNNFSDAPLPVGGSYTFPDINVTIKTLSASPTGAQVQVGNIAGTIGVNGSELHYVAAAGSTNDVSISSSGGVPTLTDRGVSSLPAGNGCLSTPDPQTVSCAGVTSARVELGDGNDSVTAAGSSLPLTALGDSGNDTLTGGAADDTLRGGLGADVMSGGAGADRADYSDHEKTVKADLDGATGDDGQSGEKDTIASDVEGIVGGARNDKLTGNSTANTLFGGAGLDRLYGRDGDDTLHGGADKDVLFGEAGIDTLHGDEGRNTIFGGDGNDILNSIADPGGYGDILNGGDGNDSFSADDGDDRDRIGCGDGSDIANVDQFDTAKASQCESIL